MANSPALRVLSCDLAHVRGVAPLATLVRSLAPDVVLLQHGPRRLRWRTRGAGLANRFGLVVAGGGEPALGNLVLVSLRVKVHESWCMRFPLSPGQLRCGAVFVRGSVLGHRFVVGSSALGARAEQRSAQAVLLDRMLSEVDDPVLMAAELRDRPDSALWRSVVGGRIDAGAGRRTSPSPGVVVVSRGFAVGDYREVAVAGAGQSPIMVDLKLPASADDGQMVSGSGSH